jgi:hypothetical protein
VEAALGINTLLRECRNGPCEAARLLNGGARRFTDFEIESRFSNRVRAR